MQSMCCPGLFQILLCCAACRYDLDPAYNFHMMQYRLDRNIGVNRLFQEKNQSSWIHYNAYAIETVFHELMLTSEHR